MPVDVSELMVLKYYVDKTNKEVKRLHEENESRRKELERKCTHPTTVTNRHYSSGGYDYRSSVTVTTTCCICDKVIESYDDPDHRGTFG